MSVFKTPTTKQKEAYGRVFHTLSSASIIGAVSVMFTETQATLYVVTKICALFAWGVLLFVLGALMCKGD